MPEYSVWLHAAVLEGETVAAVTLRQRLADALRVVGVPLDIGMALLACAYIVIGEYNDGVFGVRSTPLSKGIEIAITGLFVLAYAVRLYVAEDRWKFVRTHVIELLTLISALRLLRALQFIRVLRLLRIARLAVVSRAFSRLVRAFDAASAAFSDPVLAYGIIGVVALVFFGALALLQCEKGVNANIHDFNDAFWSAFSIILTIGFSSAKPVSAEGRFVMGILIVGGLTCISFFTTSLTIRFQRKSVDETTLRLQRIETMLEELLEREFESERERVS
ncbi:MAG: ion transporter [Vulcanimicrobiaceae bacterium]